MKKNAKMIFILFIIPILSIGLMSNTLACSISDNYDNHDSAGYHYNVNDESGQYIGYVSELEEPNGKWAIWVDGIGASNDLFDTREQAVEALCTQTE